TDRKTFVIELETPFGLVLAALGEPSASPSFIMPARVAATDPNEQVKDIIGSAPYRFSKDEWQPGNSAVYVRTADYVPRRENPSGAAGAKRALVDRVEWRYIPDAATAGAALEAGEVDYWENVPLDFAPRLESNQNLRVFVTDPRGSQGILRPNHLHPPFNNKTARQALLLAVDQKSDMQARTANVDLHAMDWSTMVSRRAKKEPPAQGGWNVFHTWSTSFDTMTPAVSSVLGGAGEKAWFGWPTSEAMEKLRADFAREPNEAKRKAIAEKVQVLAYDEV